MEENGYVGNYDELIKSEMHRLYELEAKVPQWVLQCNQFFKKYKEIENLMIGIINIFKQR